MCRSLLSSPSWNAIRFVHILPHEQQRQTLIHLTTDKWQAIERRLSALNIQTGLLNCTNHDYSNLCRTLNNERFVLLAPSMHRRSTKLYTYDIFSSRHYDYQYILKWLSKTLDVHSHSDFDWYGSATEHRSMLEYRINSDAPSSTLPIHYFTLLYRYGSSVHFRLIRDKQQTVQITFLLHNSPNHTYIYNEKNIALSAHEIYSYRPLDQFLACVTISTRTLMSIYFVVLNVYLSYDLYLVQSFALAKKIFALNLISACLWSTCFTYVSTSSLDSGLQMGAFYLIKYSHSSLMLTHLRNDLFVYSLMPKWMLSLLMVSLHVTLGLSFRWYLKKKLGRMISDVSDTSNLKRMTPVESELEQEYSGREFLLQEKGCVDIGASSTAFRHPTTQ